jgi:cell cycle arrest protein BUB3
MSQSTTPEPIALPNPPNDGITSLQYIDTKNNSSSSQQQLLASTSWDGALRLHDTSTKTHVLTHVMECGPLLSLTSSSSGGKVYTGGIDGSIRQFDIDTSTTSLIGMHGSISSSDDKKVACSALSAIHNSSSALIASAGWDAKFHLWDVRCSSSSSSSSTHHHQPVITLDLPGKAFAMDTSLDGTKVVVATSGRKNCFIDVRSSSLLTVNNSSNNNNDKENSEKTTPPPIANMILQRDSSLKYQTRCIKFFRPSPQGIAIGSIEGRVGIEYLTDIGLPNPENKKKYAFKCHRVNDTIYPVNDIVFHPMYGTFATGGADGTVVTWDGNSKKKLSSLAKLPTSIACLAFNKDGTELAMASSYTFEEGERDHPREEIYVREILESEVKPKVVAK